MDEFTLDLKYGSSKTRSFDVFIVIEGLFPISGLSTTRDMGYITLTQSGNYSEQEGLIENYSYRIATSSVTYASPEPLVYSVTSAHKTGPVQLFNKLDPLDNNGLTIKKDPVTRFQGTKWSVIVTVLIYKA